MTTNKYKQAKEAHMFRTFSSNSTRQDKYERTERNNVPTSLPNKLCDWVQTEIVSNCFKDIFLHVKENINIHCH